MSHFLICATSSWIYFFLLFVFSRLHRVQFLEILRSTLNSGSSFSTGDSALRSSFPALGSSGVICWVTLFLFQHSLHSLHLFPGATGCTLRGVLMLLLLLLLLQLPSTLKVQSSVRDEASRVYQIKFVPFFEKSPCRCNLPGTKLKTITALDLVRQNRNPLACARPN